MHVKSLCFYPLCLKSQVGDPVIYECLEKYFKITKFKIKANWLRCCTTVKNYSHEMRTCTVGNNSMGDAILHGVMKHNNYCSSVNDNEIIGHLVVMRK